MKRTIWIPIVLAAIAAALVMGTSRFGVEAKSGVAQARPSAALDVPKFSVDPAWPKIPNNWQFGQVASVSVDAQDHVWVLQRPGTLSRKRSRGPRRRCWSSTLPATSFRHGEDPARVMNGRTPSTASTSTRRASSGLAATARKTIRYSSSRRPGSS